MSLDQCFDDLTVDSSGAFVWEDADVIMVESTGGDLYLKSVGNYNQINDGKKN